MPFYHKQHEFYCGIDLHASKMYLCILDAQGEILEVFQGMISKERLFQAAEQHLVAEGS